MSLELMTGGIKSELLIDLRSFSTLGDMKAELERNLRVIDNYLAGDEVSLDIGSNRLTGRQLKELEDILYDHKLCLKELFCESSPAEASLSTTEGISQLGEEISDKSDTTLIFRNLRSGQRLITRGNIAILGDVNPGAEIIAGGSILVMGALRGMAHAGAFGDEDSIIVACRLNPTQLRISDHITRPPDGEAIEVNNPELARIRADRVVIEKLKI